MKQIPEYGGDYSATEDGQIIDHKARKPHYFGEHVVKQFPICGGYLMVQLWKDKEVKTIKVHRMIAKTFIPNPFNLPCVNHKNGIKTDNHVENLEWCSYKENTQHAIKIGTWRNAHIKTAKQLQSLKQKKQLKALKATKQVST